MQGPGPYLVGFPAFSRESAFSAKSKNILIDYSAGLLQGLGATAGPRATAGLGQKPH